MCLCCVIDETGLFGAGNWILRCVCVVLLVELVCLGREMGF